MLEQRRLALEEGIHSLIADIYDAALEPERWPVTLGKIGDAIGAAAANIAIFDGTGACRELLASGIPSEYQDRFRTEFSTPDTNPTLAIASRMQIGVPVFMAEEVGMATWMSSQFYQEMYRPIGLLHPVCTMVEKGSNCNAGFAVQLPEGMDSFRPDEQKLLMAVISHVQRAVGLSLRFGALSQRSMVLAEAINSLTSIGVVLVDSAGTVILANRTAEEISRERDGFVLGMNGVSGATSELARQLERAIAAAVQTSSGDGLCAGATIRLLRPSGRWPLLAIVSPVGKVEWSLLLRRPAAMILICDPDREVLLPPERLSQLFALTEREAQIGALLAQGVDLKEAAARLGLSRATVQTHLKRIMEKTGTHRQAELVSLILRSLSGLSTAVGGLVDS